VTACSVPSPRRCDSAHVTLPPVFAQGELSPGSLSFGDQRLGTDSGPQPLTLTNVGNDPLSITGIAISGDFVQSTNNCSSALSPSGTCTFSIVFAPTARGLRSGAVTVTSNATNSPQTATLSGIGIAPHADLSPRSLDFGKQLVGAPGPAQTVTLTNSGPAP